MSLTFAVFCRFSTEVIPHSCSTAWGWNIVKQQSRSRSRTPCTLAATDGMALADFVDKKVQYFSQCRESMPFSLENTLSPSVSRKILLSTFLSTKQNLVTTLGQDTGRERKRDRPL